MFARKAHTEREPEESIFVSMTDLTVSMLMIVIVLLGFFASQMKDAESISELELTRRKLQQLTFELSEAQSRSGALQRLEEEIIVLRSDFAKKEQDFLVTKSNYESELLSLTNSVIVAEGVNSDLHRQIVQLRQENDVLISSLKNYSEQLGLLNGQIASNESQKQDMLAEREENLNRIANLQLALNDALLTIQEQQNISDIQAASLDEERLANRNLVAENVSLRDNLDRELERVYQQQVTIGLLEAEISEALIKEASLTDRTGVLETEIFEKNDEIEILREELRAASIALDVSAAEVAELNLKIDEFLNSPRNSNDEELIMNLKIAQDRIRTLESIYEQCESSDLPQAREQASQNRRELEVCTRNTNKLADELLKLLASGATIK